MYRKSQSGTEGIYQPLHAEGSIRVLELQPGGFQAALHANLRIANVDDPRTEYEALSYTWGSSTKSHSIRINSSDHNTCITDNLYNALRRLRKRDEIRSLWVDAICIDQSNLVERNHQVAMMGDIYEAASRVNIWLGEPGQPWPVHRSIVQSIKPGEVKNFANLSFTETYKWGMLMGQLHSALRRTTPVWHTRVWVVQEAAYAQDLYLCFGCFQMQYGESLGASMLFAENKVLRTIMGQSEITRDLIRSLISFTNLPAGGNTLLGAIKLVHGNLSATDPRDYVYGISSFITVERAVTMGFDYSLTAEQVYAKATFISLRYDGDCGILSFLETKTRNHGLPTWAVDFQAIDDFTIQQNDCFGERLYSGEHETTHRLVLHVDSSITLGEDMRRLTLTTFWSDTVTALRLRNEISSAIHDQGLLRFLVDSLTRLTSSAGDLSRERVEKANQALIHRLEDSNSNSNSNSTSTIVNAWQRVLTGLHDDDGPEPSWPMEQVTESFDSASRNSNIVRTSSGLVGFAPATVEEGDTIVMFPRVSHDQSPFLVIRPTSDPAMFRYISRAYVHGPMFDAFWKQPYAPPWMATQFIIE